MGEPLYGDLLRMGLRKRKKPSTFIPPRKKDVVTSQVIQADKCQISNDLEGLNWSQDVNVNPIILNSFQINKQEEKVEERPISSDPLLKNWVAKSLNIDELELSQADTTWKTEDEPSEKLPASYSFFDNGCCVDERTESNTGNPYLDLGLQTDCVPENKIEQGSELKDNHKKPCNEIDNQWPEEYKELDPDSEAISKQHLELSSLESIVEESVDFDQPIALNDNGDENFNYYNFVNEANREDDVRDLNCVRHIYSLPPLNIEGSNAECDQVTPSIGNYIEVVRNRRRLNKRFKRRKQVSSPVVSSNVEAYSVYGSRYVCDITESLPSSFTSYEERFLWYYSSWRNARVQTEELRSGQLPVQDKDLDCEFKNGLKKLLLRTKTSAEHLDTEEILDVLKFYSAERKLLLLDYFVKAYMKTDGPRIASILKSLTGRKLERIFFLKNPQLLQTLNKVASQTTNGNLSCLSRRLVAQIKKLYPLAPGKDFMKTFAAECKKFRKSTGHLPEFFEVCLLTKEPLYVCSDEDSDEDCRIPETHK